MEERGMHMTTRGELKDRAKACLRNYYWWAFAACILSMILMGGDFNGLRLQWNVDMTSLGKNAATLADGMKGFPSVERGWDPLFLYMIMSVLCVMVPVLAISFAIRVLWTAFVGNVVWVGKCRYFMENRRFMGTAGMRNLFWGFDCGAFRNVVKVMFMRWLFIFLWSLLFVIPGIIKSYEYYLVPYILQDDPTLHYAEALQRSKNLMYGSKWRLFVLQLSFLGWELLGLLCCGVGVLFVAPYREAVYAEFYADLRDGDAPMAEPYFNPVSNMPPGY